MSIMTHRRVCSWFGIVALVLLTACSTTRRPAPVEAVDELSQKARVVSVHYDPEKFAIWTGEGSARGLAVGLLFGAIGSAIESGIQLSNAREAGAKFISASQLTDPTAQMESRFLAAWQRELRLSDRPSSRLANSDTPGSLQEQFGTGYVIDFRTNKWAIEPLTSGGFNSAGTNFRPTYVGRARLIRLDDRKTLWEGTCEYARDQTLTPVLTREQISGNDQGTAVKAAMLTLSEACADYLWRQFFGRESGPDVPPAILTESKP